MRWLAVLTLVVAVARPAAGQKAAVLEAGQALFDAMARKDTSAIRRLLHPAAQFIATVEDGDSTVSRATWGQDFITTIAAYPGFPLERMWNAEVRVSGPIASIWTQYDFHRDREFSHCGIDSFQLIKTPRGWQVATIVYTVVRPASRCPANPLGPPK